MHVLITGGAGFIGSATAVKLMERGHRVTVLDNFSEQVHGTHPAESPTWEKIASEVTLIQGDIRDRNVVDLGVRSVDAVLHLAAETGTGQSMYSVMHYADVNVMGTANLLEAVANRGRPLEALVVASSRSIYGEGCYHCSEHGYVFPRGRSIERMAQGLFEPICAQCARELVPSATNEDSLLAPSSIYAATKLTQENMVLAIASALGIQAYALRYQNVYGAGQSLSNPYTGILSIFSREILAGRPIEIFEDGKESRDFIHVDDVAQANILALEDRGGGQHILNVGSGKPTQVNEVVTLLQKAYGRNVDVRISGRFRAGDIRHNFASTDGLTSQLAFTPHISFEAGVATLCDWVQDEIKRSVQGKSYMDSLSELENRGLIK